VVPDHRQDAQAVFGWSYRHLDPARADAFRRLAAHAGSSDLAGAAHLTASSTEQARTLLDALARAHLVEPARHRAGPPRWHPHDLLRGYAAELSQRTARSAHPVVSQLQVLGAPAVFA
jgi:hypothetical protein